MTEIEAAQAREKIARYNRLFEFRTKVYEALCTVRKDDPSGPHGKGPFTGNNRESRDVVALRIWFSPTKGGAPEVDMLISNLHISAWKFGRDIEALLDEKLKEIDKAIEEI